MKITTFNPMILSPKADEVIKLFEELCEGFHVLCQNLRVKRCDFHFLSS
ncbi:MAG: hypothetical protein K5897_08260 [Eubacterium sp.]|nr:hypothetical protein [Eubacterium sp.]